jgi:Fur family ferric uptake transcriptional regulator
VSHRAAIWAGVRDRLHERGLRWTPQRRKLIEILKSTSGHVTGAELVERCRALDAGTVPSTVYRTLDVLEELGLVSHSHGHDGREEYHVLPEGDHAHLTCTRCGRVAELSPAGAAPFIAALQADHGFTVKLSHLNVGGLCAACVAAPSKAARAAEPSAAPGAGIHGGHRH